MINQDRNHFLKINFFLCALYVITGFLGIQQAIPPGYATSIWMPSGISLAFALIYGLKVLPGIFAGSFILNLYISLANLGEFQNLSYMVATVIGFGAISQTAVGFYLIKWSIGIGNPLLTPRSILLFTVLASPISCLVNASLSMTFLWFTNLIPNDAFALSWLTWWLGDSIGVLIFTPSCLILLAQPAEIWRPRIFTVLIPLVLTFTLLLLTHHFIQQREELRIRRDYIDAMELKKELVKNKITLDIIIAKYVGFYIQNQQKLNKSTFDQFAGFIFDRKKALQAITWIPEINDRLNHENQAQQEVSPDYQIKQSIKGKLVEDQQRNLYYPVFYIYPSKGNENALGYNLGSNKIRLENLQQAALQQTIIITEPLTLVQAIKNEKSVLIFYPVLQNSTITGFVSVVVNLSQLFASMEGNRANHDYFIVYDEAKPNHPIIDFKNTSSTVKNNKFDIYYHAKLNFAARTWILSSKASTYFVNTNSSWQVWIALIAGLFCCGLLEILLMIVYAQKAYVENQVKEKTLLLEQKNTELTYLALHDPLTNVLNRRSFIKIINNHIQLFRRNKILFAILCIDIDSFKQFNDLYGHSIGDQLLKNLVKVIETSCRATDVICRYGGDEFAVLLPGLKYAADAGRIAQKIIHNQFKQSHIEGISLPVTISVGIVCVDSSDDLDSKKLLIRGDIALEDAKTNGKNQFRYYSKENHIQHLRRVGVENALKQGIKENSFYLNYQPIYQLSPNQAQVVIIEAIITSDDKLLNNTEELLKIAEEIHQILELGKLTTHRACNDFIQLINRLPDSSMLKMSINISAKQIINKKHMEELIAIIDSYGIKPASIIFEITETALQKLDRGVISRLDLLMEQGFSFAIDDFGRGQTSLSLLSKLAVNYIKVDQSMVENLAEETKKMVIFKSILQITRNLNIHAIIEGIETREQFETINALLVRETEFLQGPYFSRPLSIEQIIHLLTTDKVNT